MTRKDIMKLVHKILGECKGYNIVIKKDFNQHNPKIICTIQECNMGGEYFRNFYQVNGELKCFISNINFLNLNKNYEITELQQFVWKCIKK